jgi:hypothetical protein
MIVEVVVIPFRMSTARRSSTGGSGGGWTKRLPALSSSRCTARGAQSNSARSSPRPRQAKARPTASMRSASARKLFGNSADEYLKVHHLGRSEADVTEGSGGIWERLHYDWSGPNRVVLATTDSNLWGGASGHTYTFTRQPNGTTDIDVVVVREGKNLKGRLLGFVVGTIGRRVLEKAFENSVEAIEARNSTARAARAAGAS